MRLTRPFIRLPFLFDAGRLEAEVERLGRGPWMRHPSRMRGNSAIPLISSGGWGQRLLRGAEEPDAAP